MIRILVFALIIFPALVFSQVKYDALFQPSNLDFETGKAGELPVGWTLPAYAKQRGYRASLTRDNVYSGKFCLELANDSIYKEDIYGSVMQSIEAKPYLGRKIRIRAAVRAEITSPQGSAMLWYRQHLEGNQDGPLEMMEDNPILSNEWKVYELSGTIEPYADVINFGLLLWGTGKAWIDSVSFEIVNDEPGSLEPPAELSDAGVSNLSVFANILGYVRYFHPSNEAQSEDWERFTLLGIQELEKATSTEELITGLNNMFKPVAPGIAIYPSGKKPKNLPSKEAPPKALKNVALAWMQNLAGMEIQDQKISSRVVNLYRSTRDREGAVMQTMDAGPFLGKKIKFGAWVRTDLKGVESQAQLWIRIDGANEEKLFTGTMDNAPITGKSWKLYEIEADVPQNAVTIRLGLILIGEGRAWFDDVQIAYGSNEKPEIINPKNPDFENGSPGEIVRGWLLPASAKKAGYSAENSTDKPHGGKQCLIIEADPKSRIMMPEPGETVTKDLGKISFTMQVALFTDSLRTLPYPDKNPRLPILRKPENFILTASDRASRLAIAITEWNFFRHFNLFNNSTKVYDAILPEILKKAATDKDETSFLLTLKRLNSVLDDSQSRVWKGNEPTSYGLPFLWEWADSKLIVTMPHEGFTELKPGDEILALDNIPALDAIKKNEIYVSAANDDWKRRVALAMMRAGEKNSKVELKVKTGEGSIKTVTAGRTITLDEMVEPRPDRIMQVANGIYYIDMTRAKDIEFWEKYDQLYEAKGLIFDARGLSQISEHVLGFYVDKAKESIEWNWPIYTMPDKGLISFRTLKSRIEPAKKRLFNKAVFLMDERSMGYTEAILALAKYYKLGTLIGTPSAGTGGEIIPFRLPGEFNFSMTGLKGLMPDKKTSLQGPGIQPDIFVPRTLKNIRAEKDDLLEAAVNYLNK